MYGYRFFIPKYARKVVSGRFYVCQHMKEQLIVECIKIDGARYTRDAEKIWDEIKFITS